MMLSKEAEVFISSANMKYLASLGYTELKSGCKLIIPVEHLSKGSHSLVEVKCDICGKEKELKYRFYFKNFEKNGYKIYTCSSKCAQIKIHKTSLSKFGVENYSKTDEYKMKVKTTWIEKYGVDNPSKCDILKEKRRETMLNKYGVDYYVLNEDFKKKSEETSLKNYGTIHPQMSDEMKKTRIKYYKKMGFNIEDRDFELYKNNVYGLTKKHKKQLLKNWDGTDYYDGEYIKDNFDLPYYHKNYPTVDHKITIFEGYKNKLTPDTIANINNLCFTKRTINSKKNFKNEGDFILV